MENQPARMLQMLNNNAVAGLDTRGLLVAAATGPCVPSAAQYIDAESEEFFFCSAHQITVPRSDAQRGESDGVLNATDYDGVLNAAGKMLLGTALARFATAAADGVGITGKFSQYYLENANSGPWFPDHSSRHYDKARDGNGSFNSFSNVRVFGVSTDAAGKRIMLTTSCVVLHTSEWCLTRSGSMYALGELVSYGDICRLSDAIKLEN